MISKRSVEGIASAAVGEEGETVVEIGAGIGTLTAALLRAGAKVVAVELDRRMVEVLRSEFDQFPALRVLAADAVGLDLRPFIPEGFSKIRVAGNLPYAATGAFIRHLVESSGHLVKAVVTVQREVGERLQALPGTTGYGTLTVFASAVFRISTLFTLPASSFYPRPGVDSVAIELAPLQVPRARETESFRHVVRSAFQARRKTLRNALLQSKDANAARVDGALRRTGIDGRRRGETLSVEEFAQLAEAWDLE